jgi:hypothetical protein
VALFYRANSQASSIVSSPRLPDERIALLALCRVHRARRRRQLQPDGGKSWAKAALQSPVLSKALTRFRIPWRWNGGPALLQSRATDETGYVQPTREKMMAARGNRAIYHSNAITTWAVSDKGEVKHVYG